MGIKDLRSEASRLFGTVSLILAGSLGAAGCANNQQPEPTPLPEPDTADIEVPARQGPYDYSAKNLSEDMVDQVLDNVYQIHGEATYENVGWLPPDERKALEEEYGSIPVLKDGKTDDGEMVIDDYLEGDAEIHIRGEAEAVADDTMEFDWHGSGGAIMNEGDKTYFLTAEHVTGYEVLKYKGDYYKRLDNELFYFTDQPRTIQLEEEFSREKGDIAVVSGEVEEDVYNKFAKMDKMHRGNVLIHAGFPFQYERNFTVGHVSDLEELFYYFVSDMHISPGDSGSLVYVMHEGEPLIAGLTNWTNVRDGAQAINGFARVDNILDMLEENGMSVDREEAENAVHVSTKE